MNYKDKNKIIFTLNRRNKSDKIKILLKNLKKLPTSTNEISSPINTINLSANPSYLTNLNIKHTLSFKNNKKYKAQDSIKGKVNHSINTIYTKINKHINYKNENNEINDINIATIHSNGKFKNVKQHFKNNIRKKLYEKNIILSNNFINNRLKNNFSLKLGLKNKDNNLNNFRKNWKGLNISSHYLGNTTDNKFGIITNKFCVNKNVVLTYSQNNLKLKQNFDTTSIIVERNNINKRKEFKTINIPNHNNYFNGIGTTNFFPRIENVVNNEKLYQQLMDKMAIVFNNKIKEYSLHKSNEKNNNVSMAYTPNYFIKNIKNIKKQKLFAYDIDNKSNFSPLKEKNESFFLKKQENDIKNEENKSIYKVINIKNYSNKSIGVNINLK